MPQEFLVVRCYSCQTFQIHQTRKDCKFVCKICGVKQSRKKVYAQGNSKDCRIAVQTLNAQMHLDFGDEISKTFSDDEESFDMKSKITDHPKPLERSKWDQFLEPENDILDSDNESSNQNKIFPEVDTKASDRINREILSEIDESSSHTFNKFLASSFTTGKRFHNGELKNKTHEKVLKDDDDCIKENAIKKFQNVDDNILDILNTSFCC